MRFQGGFALTEALEALGALVAEPFPRDSARFQTLDAPGFSGPESLAVAGSRTRLSDLRTLRAAMLLAEPGVTGFPAVIPVLRVRDARRAVAALLNAFSDRIPRALSLVAGEGGDIEPGAVVRANVRIGRNCVVQSGAVIGCAGFGFFDDDGDLEPMPHLAGVEIGDDCFIGANTVIAAGVLHPTKIGDGCKLDSHVQIAHNVRLGKRCLLASQGGIAGSTVVGDGFRMGGAASVAGHLRIGNNVSVAACSGVTKDWPDGSVVAGFPAMSIRAWRRREALLRRLEKEGRFSPEGDFA